jgi:hypothetical protein
MRPDLSATPGEPLSAAAPSAKLTPVAPVSPLESSARGEQDADGLGRMRGEQGMVDPKAGGESRSAVPVGRRSAPRLRLSLPARLIAVEKVHTCILLNLSRTGAQVAILDSIREGEGAILRCGAINNFAIVTRSEFGLNAMQFDEPLTNEIVLEIRRYHENFEEREKRALIETARKWVNGDTGDERPI